MCSIDFVRATNFNVQISFTCVNSIGTNPEANRLYPENEFTAETCLLCDFQDGNKS